MKRRMIILASIAGVLLFGVIAVMASLLLPFANTALAQNSGGSGRVMVLAVEQNINGERFGGEVRVTFEEAAELPAEAPDADGLYLGRDGSTLTLGGSPIEVTVDVEVVNNEEPATTVNASHGGAEMTVVVTDATLIYEDTTPQPDITPADIEAGELTVTRTVTPGSLDDLGENMLVRAWGSEQDGVLVADILVYEAIQ